ncbi:helix-turn-helix domain-containing protein [Georgenia ruanii]|uniref:helix-turn-helix domain-containing protein n=1 Tax=Georgenia ruanii TaxID=348442 RepID=UPI001D001AD3|nr:helix-turn-helix transcriptional regulator [Georgenia ruanii]
MKAVNAVSIGSSSGKGRYADLARLLRARREELSLSRRDVVEETGLSYPYISQLEGGYRAPSMGSARKLADALGLPVEDLVRASGGEAQRTTSPRERSRSTSWITNPTYAAGTALRRSDQAAPAADSAVHRAEAPLSADAAPERSEPSHPQDVAAVADEIATVLRSLPSTSRLNALALAQSQLMAEMVQEQVRRATES